MGTFSSSTARASRTSGGRSAHPDRATAFTQHSDDTASHDRDDAQCLLTVSFLSGQGCPMMNLGLTIDSCTVHRMRYHTLRSIMVSRLDDKRLT